MCAHVPLKQRAANRSQSSQGLMNGVEGKETVTPGPIILLFCSNPKTQICLNGYTALHVIVISDSYNKLWSRKGRMGTHTQWPGHDHPDTYYNLLHSMKFLISVLRCTWAASNSWSRYRNRVSSSPFYSLLSFLPCSCRLHWLFAVIKRQNRPVKKGDKMLWFP